MGEAKRRASAAPTVLYHHTSQIRTNLIWMSGVIQLEGQSQGAEHPLFGEIGTDVSMRRACRDFQPLAWFSRSTVIPRCLLKSDVIVTCSDGSAVDFAREIGMGQDQLANALALKRFALGFPNDPKTFTPWREHFGYSTPEGRELNETASAAGDDPDMWFVAEAPVEILRCTEVWASRSIFKPKLERFPEYLKEVHKMVRLCREIPGTHIPPSWTGDPAVEPMVRAKREQQANALGRVFR